MQITLEIGNHCAHDRREVSPSEGTAGGVRTRVQGRRKGGQGPQEGNLSHRKPSTAQQALQARKHQLEAPLRTGLPWFQGVRSPWELVKPHRCHILLATHTAFLLLPHSLKWVGCSVSSLRTPLISLGFLQSSLNGFPAFSLPLSKSISALRLQHRVTGSRCQFEAMGRR